MAQVPFAPLLPCPWPSAVTSTWCGMGSPIGTLGGETLNPMMSPLQLQVIVMWSTPRPGPMPGQGGKPGPGALQR